MKRYVLPLLLAATLAAQEGSLDQPPPKVPEPSNPTVPTNPPSPTFTWANLPSLVGGALVGLAIHESGHVLANVVLNTDPYLTRVETSGLPFFAVSHRKLGTPREEYAIASAGFWLQHAMAEALLERHPNVWKDASLLERGAFTFHLVTSFVYTYGALAKSGPPERDTLGMARSLRIDERWVGLAVLVPALLDLYRSFHPEARGARWASRGLKVGFVLALTR